MFFIFFFPPSLCFRVKPFYLGEGRLQDLLVLDLPQTLRRLFMQKHAVRKGEHRVTLFTGFISLQSSPHSRLLHTIPTTPIPGVSLLHFYSEEYHCFFCFFVFLTKLGSFSHLCHWPFKIVRFPKKNVFFLAKRKNTGEAQIFHIEKEDTYAWGHLKNFP